MDKLNIRFSFVIVTNLSFFCFQYVFNIFICKSQCRSLIYFQLSLSSFFLQICEFYLFVSIKRKYIVYLRYIESSYIFGALFQFSRRNTKIYLRLRLFCENTPSGGLRGYKRACKYLISSRDIRNCKWSISGICLSRQTCSQAFTPPIHP